MKHTISGFLVVKLYDFLDKPMYDFLSYRPDSKSGEIVVIRPMEMEVDVPDDFDPRPQQIAVLEQTKNEMRAEFAKRVTEIDARIASLQAIENARA